MRFCTLILAVMVVTHHLISVSGFASYAMISKNMKVQGMLVEHRSHESIITSTVIELNRGKTYGCPSLTTQLHESSNKKKGGLDESVRTKLVSESIAPWRTLRLFLYFSLGSGALVGGLITLTGFAAVVSGAKEGNINTEVRTL